MQNGPIFVRRRLQLTYNQKTCYLPIFEDCHPHKPLLKKALQKHQKMQSFSMHFVKKRLTNRFCCQPFIILSIELLSEMVYCASAAISSTLSALLTVAA